MNRILALLFSLCIISTAISAQELGYSFKTGLNAAVILGDNETDSNGTEVEEYRFNRGFHVGGDLIIKFVDRFGMKVGLLYNQKGGKYRFGFDEEPGSDSFQRFTTDAGNEIFSTGKKRISLNITNTYLDFPIVGYARFADKFEIFGGFQFGFLVSSTADGELKYSGTSETGIPIEEFAVGLDYNFYNDNVGDIDPADPIVVAIDGETATLPGILNAYYDFDTDERSWFNVFDVGLTAGVNLYINKGLFFGFTANYGLRDVTNMTYDVSKVSSNRFELIQRDDKDTNLNLLFSVGFGF